MRVFSVLGDLLH